MRLSEILNLKWENVVTQKKFIKVEHTKSGKCREIPINSLLLEVFEEMQIRNDDVGFVFFYKSIRTAFENAKSRAGIKNFTFHDLRRTFGTRLLEQGVNIVTISKLYGHSNVLITQRYLHPQDKLSVMAVELLVAKQEKNTQKKGDLLHICDKKKDSPLQKTVSNLYSIN